MIASGLDNCYSCIGNFQIMSVSTESKSRIEKDQDTGLPIEVLREELLKAKNSPTVEFSIETIRKKGQEKLKELQKRSK